MEAGSKSISGEKKSRSETLQLETFLNSLMQWFSTAFELSSPNKDL